MKETATIITHRKLENGMELFLYDRSRLMAKDRWLIEILCKAFIPLDEKLWDGLTAEDLKQESVIRKMLGDRLIFSSSNKRVFVDDRQKEAVLQEMTRQMSTTILAYINRPEFPEQLFRKKVRDARRQLMIQEAMNQAQRRLAEE